MPSATNGTRTVKSASPDLGSAPGSMNQITASNQLTGTQSEALKQVLVVLEKKVRNMEKKKSKLDDYQARNIKGERLNQDQLEALSKYQEIIHNLEFARELHKSFLALGQEIQKSVKKAARREQLQREEVEQKRLKRVLELQFLLDRLGDESVRQELLQGAGGLSLLTESDLTSLDEFYKLVGPERDQNIRLTDQYQDASQHLWELLEGKDKPVAGTTYKALNETLERVLQSGYFDRMQSHQNGVCTEEEEQTAAVEVSEAEEHPPDTEGEMTEAYAEPIPIEVTEFVNRQFVLESTYSTGDKEQREEWSAEMEVVNSMQPVQTAPTPVVPEPHPLTTVTPTPPSDPVVRQQVVQDLMAQMQGPYNFMQDSMLDFDGQSLDPAIVLAQPMKPVPSMEMPPMVCQPAHPESCLAQPHAVGVQPEPTQIPMASTSPETFSTPPPIYQSSHSVDPRPQTDTTDPIQASMPLTEQPPPSTVLSPASQTQVIQPGSKPLHSSGINVNAAPFQSMQTVFNLNAPVPPANDTDSMKQASQYQNSYSQGFNSQTQHPVEQTDMPPEQLQSVVGAFHSQDQSLPISTGPQPMSQQSGGQGNGFSRQAQSFYNSRGISRGGPRNSRGMINGYRGPSNGFRGGYDGYRQPFNSANSGYGQTQFSVPRDYSNSGYQRDGYQQNYKRGAGQGARGVSRGSAPAMRS
ncbi:caprin-1-like isoform X1 [Sinocyclocheilus rhinocerous]|uniref:Caprin-1 dimerization domain-containing protein n=1 Tax=Sinocyclocheilus rhinocerous TaxID=307959 RepID=A0A673HT35_9TELE|nr:PREDICTED: caprin-1-like isoform X1 [Sinocyclocheilus rhinocerous]